MFQIVKSHSDSLAFLIITNQHSHTRDSAVEKVNVIYIRQEGNQENQRRREKKGAKRRSSYRLVKFHKSRKTSFPIGRQEIVSKL
jgi:hypothetical protein